MGMVRVFFLLSGFKILFRGRFYDFRVYKTCTHYGLRSSVAAPLSLWLPNAPTPSSDWIPAGVEQLGRTAAFHTDFTFDRTMLQMASGLIDGGDADTRNAIAKLNGVTVHLYRYAQPGMYDARQLDAIRQQYKAAGWKHLVSTQSQGKTANTAHRTRPRRRRRPGTYRPLTSNSRART